MTKIYKFNFKEVSLHIVIKCNDERKKRYLSES